MIEQLTRAEYERRMPVWHQAAMNDASVHPFLSTAAWRGISEAPSNDWDRATFMDSTGAGVLNLTIDRETRTAAVGLFVLGRDARVAAALMRYLARVVPKRYGIEQLSFCIAENNTAWRERAQRIFGQWLWGVEPQGAHDVSTGKRVSLYHFKVPVCEVSRSAQRGTQCS